VRAVLRRSARPWQQHELPKDITIKIGQIEIDTLAMKVLVQGKNVTTTSLEFRLMEFLARNEGRVFTRDQLLDAVWGDTRFVTARTVDTCVRRVRSKIEINRSSPSYLVTVRGVGYRFAKSVAAEHLLELVRSSPCYETIENSPRMLSKREIEVAESAVQGHTNKQIARQLRLSEHTVKNYLFRIFEKLGVSNRMELLFLLSAQNKDNAPPCGIH